MKFLAFLGPGRSGLALRIAAVGYVLFAVFVVLFNADYSFREPLMGYGFPLNALLFHVGLGFAIAALVGPAGKRGRHAWWALLANLVPVAGFWLMVYAIIVALRNFN